jgi:CheY-like chemotaxis protein
MLRRIRILVIDDDPSILDLIEAFLESIDHYVVARMSGSEGLDALRDETFDLVISDINMAGMNGFEFLKIARANYPDIGIILMTAYADEYPLSETLEAGADGYITKPFTLTKFSLILERAYWKALSRQDWWDTRDKNAEAS